MYEFHTTQEGTGIHPGETFDADYSLMGSVRRTASLALQMGITGYEARQTTAKTGPDITPAVSAERYAINAFGFGVRSPCSRNGRRASASVTLRNSPTGRRFRAIRRRFRGESVSEECYARRIRWLKLCWNWTIFKAARCARARLLTRRRYLLFRIDDRNAGREFMSRLRSVVASAAQSERSHRDTWVSVALSYQGLKALGVPQASLESFSPEFQQGMAARAKSLGDTGESSPEHWEKPLGSADVHVVITAVAPSTRAVGSGIRKSPEKLRGI